MQRKKKGHENLENLKALLIYSNNLQDVYKNTEQ